MWAWLEGMLGGGLRCGLAAGRGLLLVGSGLGEVWLK